MISKLQKHVDLIIISCIFILALAASVNYSLNRFELVSDSYREYIVYLKFVEIQEWQPLPDSMLSTCIFTTYLPSTIQVVLNINDPTIVYKLTLAVLTAPLPALMYCLLRNFTGIILSITLVFILITSSYFSGFAMYARMLIASTFIITFLIGAYSHEKSRIQLMLLSMIGIVLSHYTMAFLFLIMLYFAMLLDISRSKAKADVTISFLFFNSIVLLYYGWICRYTRVLQYAYTEVQKQIVELFNYKIPDYPLPYKQTTVPINPFANQTSDFVLAKGVILLRAGFIIAVLVSFWRRGEFKQSPLPYFITGSLIISVVSIWLPTVSTAIGSVRPAFFSLLFELPAIALWAGEAKQRYLLSTMLFLAACLPH